jgi:hypothetical protein
LRGRTVTSTLQASIARQRRQATLARYATINWIHHAVPTLEAAFGAFCESMRVAEAGTLIGGLLSAAYARGELEAPADPVWGDTFSIYFGGRAVPAVPIADRPRRTSALSESGARLAFYKGVSGAIVAVISPPESKAQSASQPDYVVGIWPNPLDMREHTVRTLLLLAWEVHLSCGAAVFPNKRGIGLLGKLDSLHVSYQSPRQGLLSRMYGWFVSYGRTAGTVYHTHAIGQIVPSLAAMKLAALAALA